MIKVAVVYHSGFGHTKRMAEAVIDGAQSQGDVSVLLLTATEACERIDELDDADAIVFGSPTYMGNIAAEMKRFMEVAAKKWFVQAWKDKIAGAFTNSSSFSGDKLNTLMGLVINAMQHGMIYVSLGMLPAENEPESMKSIQGPGPDALNRAGSYIGPISASFQLTPDHGPTKGDLETARRYGLRIATVARQYHRGRE
ncbi:flavodoxin family protein [bacterium]|nr:flavodoxin family protein [candidate division CSSED10-310 bacterium]